MKTSTILILILISGLLITLFLFNYTLKQHYLAGDFRERVYGSSLVEYVKKDIPPAKHLVIDGIITSGDLKNGIVRSTYGIARNISINYTKGQNYVEVATGSSPLFRTQLIHDTLYIDYYRKNPIKTIMPDYGYSLKIYVNSIESISAKRTHCEIKGFTNLAKLNLMTYMGGRISVQDLVSKKLSIIAKDSTRIAVVGNEGAIGELSYSLSKKSVLDVNDASNIRQYSPVKVDSLAHISIGGKAAAIGKILSGLSRSTP